MHDGAPELTNLASHLRDLVAERTRDITRVRQEFSETLERTEHEAFVYTVAHDLKAPMSSIHLAVEALIDRHGPELSSGALRELARLGRLAKRVENVLDDLLSAFHISAAVSTLAEPMPSCTCSLGQPCG